jgi:hypothetical protein
VNKSVALPLLMTLSFLFGDNNVQVRLENGQKAQGEFIGTYMNHVHILIGEKIIYYACGDIISITSASEGLSYGKGYDYDCSKNTVTADILFPPAFDPMTGEMAQILPDVFNPDIPKPAVEKATPVVQKPAAKIEASVDSGGVSAAEDFVIIDGVKYARVVPEKETAQADPKTDVSVRAILPGQKSAIQSLSRAAGFTNTDLSTYLMQNYGQTLDGLSHKQGTNVINKFQAGSVSKPNPETGTRGTTLSTLEIRSQALMNARQKHVGPLWGLLGLAGCGSGLMGGTMGGEMADFPGFLIGGTIGLGLPSLIASGSASSISVPYYPAEIKTQSGKQLYKEAYVKETGLLRRRSTTTGTGVGLVGFGAFMLMLIMSF